LPDSLANFDYGTYYVLIERSFQGLLDAIKIIEIIEKLIEINPNQVCGILLITLLASTSNLLC